MNLKREYLCATCGPIGAGAAACQKTGWEEQDTSLPGAVADLVDVKAVAGAPNRGALLKTCPTCGDHFLYTSDYDFLANGSEDRQGIRRLTPREVREFMGG